MRATIEFDLHGERENPLTLSAMGDGYWSLGFKEWASKPGEFKYRWLVEYMDMAEIESLHQVLDFILSHDVEPEWG